MDEKRICDYFVIAGIPTNHRRTNRQSPSSSSLSDQPLSPIGSSGTGLPPITDIAVIIPDEGEPVPEGFTCIETTPSGFSADLNHGSIRTQSVFLCYKRGTDKPPLVDIGVLYEAKERVMADSEIVKLTPYGRLANVNNGTSRTFLTFRRAKDDAPCNQLVVIDICVVLMNKGETPPHAYCLINKNLNKGIIGNDVFICYKKSMNRPPSLRYEPSILGRFPLVDYDCYPLPESVSLFCMPMGAMVECWPQKSQQPRPLFSTFVLTSNAAVKVYGAAITFYERFNEDLLNDDEKSRLNYVSEEDRASKTLNTVKSICILSRWPFFDTFEKFLTFLYHITCCSPNVPHPIPIERYISHFMLDVPFPSFQRPKILIQLGNSSDKTALLSQPPEDMPLPLSGASFTQFLRNLGPENCIIVLLLVLAEQKILLHSLRPDVLTSVAEALTSLIFPFHWQCPYIPLCPLGLCDVLNAPLPFIAGVDSRYFDMYELPLDVACVDLDTNSIYISEHKKILNIKLLPKKPTRVLKNTLEKLYERLSKPHPRLALWVGNTYNPQSKSRTSISPPFANEFIAARKTERMIDLEIQEIFVKFMASILKNFRSYLRPITKAPTIGATDPNSLFDFQGFLRSRDKAYQYFYHLLMRTQMFTRFIEERSFVSDKNTSLAFFDECLDKIEAYGDLDSALKLRLLDSDESSQNDRTVFIPAPEPVSSETCEYDGFPQLDHSLFHRHPSLNRIDVDAADSSNLSRAGSTALLGSPMSRRTKQEIRSAQRVARRHAETPLTWAKCLVSYCYSLWFIHLPSFVEATYSLMPKGKQLRMAYTVLERMQVLNLHPIDEVCYRILMLLCGVYSQPILAVKVLTEMKRYGVTPNAITYGYYNKAVLESKWPSGDSSASIMWTRLRNVILGIAQFRQSARIAKGRMNTSASSPKEETLTNANTEEPSPLSQYTNKLTHHLTSSNQSDAGYCSSVNNNGENELNTSDLSISGTTVLSDKVTPRVKLRQTSNHNLSEFRIRTRSIVRNSSSSLFNYEDYNSLAGVLMSSQVLNRYRFNDSPLMDNPFERKRHKSEDQIQNKDQKTLCLTPKPNSEQLSVDTTLNRPRPVKHSYFRSFSFGNDARIMRNIKEGSLKILKMEFEKKETIDENPACSEKELKVDQSSKELESSPIPSENRPLNGTSGSQNSDSQSSEHRSLESEISDEESSDDDSDSDSSKEENGSNSQNDSPFSFTPIKDHIMNMNIFSPEGKVASTLRSSFRIASRLAVGPTPKNSSSVPRSTSFHSNPAHTFVPQKLSNRFNNLFKTRSEEGDSEKQKSITRSATLPLSESPRESLSEDLAEKSLFNKDCSEDEDKASQSSLGHSPWTAKLSKGKHLELVNSTIKSATNTISSRITGIKNTLAASATNSPSKSHSASTTKENRYPSIPGATSLLSQWASMVVEKLPTNAFMYEDDDATSLCSHDLKRLSIAASEDDVSERSRDGSLGRNLTGFGFLPQNAVNSPPFFEIIEKHYKESLILSTRSASIVVKIRITSCNRCQSCSSILYDEEIMESWSADDSNLSTQCCICRTTFVPLLTVEVKQLDCDSPFFKENKTDLGKSEENIKEPSKVSNGLSVGTHPESILSQDNQKAEPKFELLDTFNVPYLSPIVLRKEVENVLESEGDGCLVKSEFLDDHPILYWNLLWYFERINLPSHISEFSLRSLSVMKDQKNVDKWQSFDFRNVKIHCIWDAPKLYNDFEKPMYLILRESSSHHSSLLHALVTEDRKITQHIMKQIVTCIECNDMLSAMNLLLTERYKQNTLNGTRRYFSMYRDLLYLTFSAIGRENIDENSFDREYRRSYEALIIKHHSVLTKMDQPPSFKAIFCRKIFKDLELDFNEDSNSSRNLSKISQSQQ